MVSDANPPEDAHRTPADASVPGRPAVRGGQGRGAEGDEAALERHALALADAMAERLGPWLAGAATALARSSGASDDTVAEVDSMARRTADGLVDEVTSLLSVDIDDQRANPLAVLRAGLTPVTRALEDAGVPPVARDEFQVEAFPDDRYGLAPATWADIHPELHGPGITWSAAKAFVFKARRRAEGRR